MRLLFQWSCLADAALDLSTGRAVLFGGIALGCELGVMFLVVGWGLGEPYATFREYLWSVPPGFVLVALLIATSWTLVQFALVWWGLHERVNPGELRAWFLAPVPALVPMLVWGVFAVIGRTSSPNLGIAAGVPPIARSFLFAWAANPLPPLLIAVGAVLSLRHAIARLRSHEKNHCVRCGYDRRGLAAEACPECGRGS